MDGFFALLERASENISHAYFQLPIAGAETPIYRERVYCYELYHSLRSIWPIGSEFSLGGEVDKAGHPLLRDSPLTRAKPDLLVHRPGNMGGNFAVIEVKSAGFSVVGLRKDLRTLRAFLSHAGYQHGVLLIYGDAEIGLLINACEKVAVNAPQGPIDLSGIELWHHRAHGERAKKVVSW